MVNSKPQSQFNPIPLNPEATAALLAKVNQQIALQTFDAKDHQLIRQMVESFGDSRGMVRLGFAEALGKVGQPAIPFLLDALANHPNPVIRRASAKTITLIADPEAIPGLVSALLNDEDIVVQSSAIGALGRMGEAAVPALLEVLASPETSESIKGQAAWALAFIGTAAKEQLYQAFSSDSEAVRTAVIGAIIGIVEQQPEEKAFNLLMDALNDSSEIVRSEAATALGKFTYQPAVTLLIQLLSHTGAESRKAAAVALMKIGDRTALDSLKTAWTQESEESVQSVMELVISQLDR